MYSDKPYPNTFPNLGNGEKGLRYKISTFLKKIVIKYNLFGDYIFPSYKGGLRPSQLYQIMKHIYETDSNQISLIEVGIARGISTVFLEEALKYTQKKTNYFCLDTFSGFDKESVLLEKKISGNKFSWDNYDYLNYDSYENAVIKKNLKLNLIKQEEYKKKLEDIKFDVVILDVDTELATLEYLEYFHKKMKPNGLIIVDDACENTKYSGALRAYQKFCKKTKISEKYLFPKSALIINI